VKANCGGVSVWFVCLFGGFFFVIFSLGDGRIWL